MITHKRVKPYQWTICDYSDNIKDYTKSHTGEKANMWAPCDPKYIHNINLYDLINIHIAENLSDTKC